VVAGGGGLILRDRQAQEGMLGLRVPGTVFIEPTVV
jgi:hypothetical protein